MVFLLWEYLDERRVTGIAGREGFASLGCSWDGRRLKTLRRR
jgi:hypothetical protein